MADDDGVLENLPKARPGKRSPKRATAAGRPAKAAAKAAAKAEAAGKPAAKPQPTGARPEPAVPRAPEQRGDAVGAVVRTAAGLAVTGARVAGAVTQELLRRLPRR